MLFFGGKALPQYDMILDWILCVDSTGLGWTRLDLTELD